MLIHFQCQCRKLNKRNGCNLPCCPQFTNCNLHAYTLQQPFTAGDWIKTAENTELLMTRLINAATAHADVLGKILPAELTQLKDGFLSACGQQLKQKRTVSKCLNTSGEARKALEIQLTKNQLTVALNNIGNSAAATHFFNKSIIDRAAKMRFWKNLNLNQLNNFV